jgi:MFS family permease
MLIANLAFPFLLIVFALTTWFPLTLGVSYCLGIGFMLQFTLINTLLQTNVTDEMRGRVLSLYTLTFFGIAPFGNLVIGWLAEVWGISITVVISAVVALVLSLAVFYWIPILKKLT